MGMRTGETEVRPNHPDPLMSECNLGSEKRENRTVISDLDGTLVRERSPFPYFMLIAFEAGSLLRATVLLLLAPIDWVLYNFVSEAAAIKLLVFFTFAGLKVKKIESVSRAVLPKFYAEDIHLDSWRVFSSRSFRKRYVTTAKPRIMVEAFAKEYLRADEVLGSEIEVTKRGRATGFVKTPGVLVGANKDNAMVEKFGKNVYDISMSNCEKDNSPVTIQCKEGFVVPDMKVDEVAKNHLPTPIIFHDGRLVCLPTPINALVTFMWLPIGFILGVLRIAVGILLPMSLVHYSCRVFRVRVIVKGTPPAPAKDGKLGVLFVCNHRSVLDPIFLSIALRRPVSAVTYSISRVTEHLSPIKTVPLSRNRELDAAHIRKLLEEGDLVICPEGTTCREPFLLRFSSLFAELTDHIVPVAMHNRMSMFHGTTATGWKGMDPFFFFMNPIPTYEVNFFNQLPLELTCSGGKTSHEVANYIQRVIAGVLSFECTNFTRKDKYNVLAGSDGFVPPKKSVHTLKLAAS